MSLQPRFPDRRPLPVEPDRVLPANPEADEATRLAAELGDARVLDRRDSPEFWAYPVTIAWDAPELPLARIGEREAR